MKLSIIIPAYNEEKRLPDTFEKVFRFFKKEGVDFEIIAVNDGSTDKTKKIIQDYQTRFRQIRLVDDIKNRGKGHAVKQGVKQATGDLILFTDADLSTPIEEYVKLKESIVQGYDIAIGSRRIKGSDIRIKQPLHRRILGRGFGFITEILLVRGIKDTQCGFKLFRHNIAKRVFQHQRIEGFCFDAEVLFLAKKIMKAKIKELPVRWVNSAALSKVNAGRETFRMFKDLITIRLRH